jgi:ribulose-5-phosphate 4-epimerase/fuculose-1-phosphate aldolase
MAECGRQRRRRGGRKPTSELDLHLRMLRRRPDVGAVVHAHPPAATAFAVAGEGFTPLCCRSLSSLHAARIHAGARVLGRVTALDPGAVARLEALRARSLRERDV